MSRPKTSQKRRPDQKKSAQKAPRMTPRERRERILDVAIRLAEEGGFENVRQRDVAAQAGVALGTLYKDFRGKGAILSAALGRETTHLESKLSRQPISGESATERIGKLFTVLTSELCRKPNYARALVRAMASGDAEIAHNIVAYQVNVYAMIVSALRGDVTAAALNATTDATESEMKLALMLQQMWFAQLVGWSARLFSIDDITAQMEFAGEVLVAGMAARTA